MNLKTSSTWFGESGSYYRDGSRVYITHKRDKPEYPAGLTLKWSTERLEKFGTYTDLVTRSYEVEGWSVYTVDPSEELRIENERLRDELNDLKRELRKLGGSYV